ANLFMHYAFDLWLEREFPAVEFERYADDAVVHCATEQQARKVLAALEERMAEVGLQLHPDKTRIVYCKDRNHLRSGTELEDIASWVNPVIRGWMTYYGKFYRTALNSLLQRINTYLVRWAKRKYKRLRTFKKVRRWWEGLTTRQPRLFAHWTWMTDFKYSL